MSLWAGADLPCFPRAICLDACDISECCRNFIASHAHPPVHVHEDLFARLSKHAMADMVASEKEIVKDLEKVDDKDKAAKQELGDSLLAKYMAILSRPGSILGKSMCALLSVKALEHTMLVLHAFTKYRVELIMLSTVHTFLYYDMYDTHIHTFIHTYMLGRGIGYSEVPNVES